MDNQNEAINRLANAAENYVHQQKWSRRWSNLLKLAVVIYILISLAYLLGFFTSEDDTQTTPKHMAVVKLDGAILPGTQTSAEGINPLLQKAFKNPNSSAVVIWANSPGGSPVQSALINDEIARLKKVYQKPVYAVVEDVCASGCYYSVVSADKIYANKGSMIGSIGVRMDMFGVTELMDKIGVENRSMHAGQHKTFLDPFGPKDEEGREFFKERILDRTHQQFINTVRKGRRDRLKENDQTFTGLVWLGDEAVQNGLIDDLGDIGSVMRDVVKVKRMQVYEGEKTLVEQLMGDLSSEFSTRLSMWMSSMK